LVHKVYPEGDAPRQIFGVPNLSHHFLYLTIGILGLSFDYGYTIIQYFGQGKTGI
jgi:hypothetical protein